MSVVVAAVLMVAAALSPIVQDARSAAASGPVRSMTDLVSGWRFHFGDVTGAANPGFDDHTWQQVSLPHTWNAFDGEDGSASATGTKEDYKRGPAWYRVHVTIPTTAGADGLPLRWYLQFDGATLATDAYVNGTNVGHHDGGYTAFRFDITPYVTSGTSAVLAVRVNNKGSLPIIPVNGDFTVFGGLYRMVHLIGVDRVHVTLLDHGGPGVVLTPTVDSSGNGQLSMHTEIDDDRATNALVTVSTSVVDAAGTTVANAATSATVRAGRFASFDEALSVPSVHRWDGLADPYLYTAKIQVIDGSGVLDEVDQNIGFRTFVVDPNNGAKLNGHPYQLHGASVHEDRQDEGSALSDAQIDADVSSLVQVGMNAMRFSHYPHNLRYVDDADATGVAIVDELPLVGSAYSTDPSYVPNVESQLTEMIRQSQNHPSVLVWSLGNELKVVHGSDPTALLQDLVALAHSLDPTRLTTQALCLGSTCPGVTSSVAAATDISGINVFTGWFSKSLSSLPSQLDSLHASVPNRALGITEYEAGVTPAFHSDQPVAKDNTAEFAITLHEAYLKAVSARPWLWCVFLWLLADHGSDRHVGGDAPGRNQSGLLSYDRTVKKDPWYLYQSWWSNTPVVRLESANWTDRTNASTTITAISNGAKVEAFLNGNSLGVVHADGKHLFQWPATLSPGPNDVSVVATMPNSSTLTDGAVWNLRTTPTKPIRIDVGSSTSTVDSQGHIWSADTDYTGGTAAQYSGSVSGTPDPQIAATYRVGQSYYAIPLDNGTYQVNIRLLEPTWNVANKRLFSISAFGVNRVYHLDLGNLVGVGVEYDVTFSVTVPTHALTLAFLATQDQAVVSGIEVLPT